MVRSSFLTFGAGFEVLLAQEHDAADLHPVPGHGPGVGRHRLRRQAARSSCVWGHLTWEGRELGGVALGGYLESILSPLFEGVGYVGWGAKTKCLSFHGTGGDRKEEGRSEVS